MKLIVKNTLFVIVMTAFFAGRAQVPSFKAVVYDSTVIKGYFFLVSNQHLLILDKNGTVVYSKDNESNNSDFKIEANGMMAYFNNGQYLLMDSTFRVVDTIGCEKYETDFHEIKILPNGNTLLLGLEPILMDLSKYQIKGRQGSDTAKVIGGVIQELDARHKVVFEWHAKDHLAFDDMDTTRDVFVTPEIEWTHWNSLDVDLDGNLLVSSRFLKEVTKINRADGSIMWRLGGKHNQFRFIDPLANGKAPFSSFNIQRNIRVLPNGHITLLDRGTHGSRGVELKIDEAKKTATVVWSYIYDPTLTSGLGGNVQRLSHSNTLLDYGFFTSKSRELCFVIVDSSGNKLFELTGARAFRTYYYDSLPFQLHRPQIACTDSAGIYYLDAGAGFKSYSWNTGDTTRLIPVKEAGNYFVSVPYGDGGFISSENYIVTDRLRPCSTMPDRLGMNSNETKKKGTSITGK